MIVVYELKKIKFINFILLKIMCVCVYVRVCIYIYFIFFTIKWTIYNINMLQIII